MMEQNGRPAFASGGGGGGANNSSMVDGGDDDEDYRSVNLLEDDSVINDDYYNKLSRPSPSSSPVAPPKTKGQPSSIAIATPLPTTTTTTAAGAGAGAEPSSLVAPAAGGRIVGTADASTSSALGSTTPFTTSKSSSFLSPSPGTKTIAALSQDMDDLRYESQVSSSSQSNNSNAAANYKAGSSSSSSSPTKASEGRGGRLKRLQKRCSKDEEELRKESSSSKEAGMTTMRNHHQQQQPQTIISVTKKKSKPQFQPTTTITTSNTRKKAGGSGNGGSGKTSPATTTDTATAALTAALLQKGGKLPSDFMDRWDVIPVSIKESRGQLGLTIVKNQFPECESGDHCKVKSVNRSSLGEKYGIKADDWIGIYDEGSATNTTSVDPSAVMSSFDVVQEMARRRPFEVHLFRQKKKMMKNNRRSSSQAAAASGVANNNNKKKPTPRVVSDSSHEEQQQKKKSSSSSSSKRFNETSSARNTSSSPPTTPLAALAAASVFTAKAQIGGGSSPRDLTSLIQAAKALEEDGGEEDSLVDDVPGQNTSKNHNQKAAGIGIGIGSNLSGNTTKHDSRDTNDSQKKSNRLLEGSSRRQRNAQTAGNDRQQQKQSKPTQKEKSTGSKGNSAAVNPREVTSSKRQGENNPSDLQPQMPTTGNHSDDKPTFCFRCNATSAATRPRKHHAWCKLNEFFDNSGAQDLMERIRQGRELDCPACEHEFTTGRPVSNKNKTFRHNSACIKNQKRLKKMAEEREEEAKREEEEKRKKEKKKSNQSKQSQKRESRPKPQSPEISSPSSSEDEDDDMEEHSEYRPRRKRRKDAHVATGNKKSRTAASKARDKAPSRVTPQSRAAALEPRDADEATNNDGGKPVWTGVPEAQNPWGPAGHATGDALLYGPLQGLCNTIEALTSSQRRYVVNPFTPSSNYQRTHESPQKGLALLVLKRDSLGNQPWGFEVTIDDFGHACLVQSVDPLSPAESATFLGMPEDSTPVGLAANDMILLVNGKPVGGMTRGAVDAEIEASGRTLLLAVSKYKHAKEAAKKFATIEQQVLGAIDSATREGQVVGWMEVGHGPQQEPNNNGVTVLEEDGSQNGDLADEGDVSASHPKVASKSNSSEINTVDRQETSESGTVQVGEKKSDSPSQAHDRDPIIVETPLPVQNLSPSNSSSKEAGGGSGSEDWEEDDNAWLGCVCGRVHSKTRKDNVFWIQCDVCNSWYDVSKNCVGFDSKEAEDIPRWVCWACPSPPQAEPVKPTIADKKNDTAHGTNKKKTESASDSSVPMEAEEREQDDGEEAVLPSVQAEPARNLSSAEPGTEENDEKEANQTRETKEVAAKEAGAVGTDSVKGDSPEKKGRTGNDTENEAVISSRIQTRGKKRKSAVEEVFVDSPKRKKQGDAEAEPGVTIVPPNTNSVTVKSPKKIQSPNTKNQGRPNDRKQDHMERTTQDGFVRPRKKLVQRSDGTYPKPSGRPFVGMDWDEVLGVWKPKASNSKKNRDEPNMQPQPLPGLPVSPRKTNNSFEHELVSPVRATEKVAFKKGDLVYVMPHSWPGRNCRGGVGNIIEIETDKEGDMVYRVKYILGGSDKGIVPDFMKMHSF